MIPFIHLERALAALRKRDVPMLTKGDWPWQSTRRAPRYFPRAVDQWRRHGVGGRSDYWRLLAGVGALSAPSRLIAIHWPCDLTDLTLDCTCAGLCSRGSG